MSPGARLGRWSRWPRRQPSPATPAGAGKRVGAAGGPKDWIRASLFSLNCVNSVCASACRSWRRLARENHPDLIGDDPAASRSATRRMAEINDAYAALTQGEAKRRSSDRAGDEGEA